MFSERSLIENSNASAADVKTIASERPPTVTVSFTVAPVWLTRRSRLPESVLPTPAWPETKPATLPDSITKAPSPFVSDAGPPLIAASHWLRMIALPGAITYQ